MGWDIVDIPKIFSYFKFKEIRNENDDIADAMGTKDGVTILSTDNTDA